MFNLFKIKDLASKSLRGKLLIWFLVISLVPLFIGGGIAFLNSQGMIKKQIFSMLDATSRSIEDKINMFIETKKIQTLEFSSDGFLKDGLTWYDPDDPNIKKMIEEVNFHLKENKKSMDKYIKDILLLDLSGEAIFSSDMKMIGKDKSDKEYFRSLKKNIAAIDITNKEFLNRLRKERKLSLYTSDVYVSDDLKMPVITISNIVLSRATFLPLGFLVVRYDANMLTDILKSEQENLGNTGKAYLLNREGFLISRPRFFSDFVRSTSGGEVDTASSEIILKEKVETRAVKEAQKILLTLQEQDKAGGKKEKQTQGKQKNAKGAKTKSGFLGVYKDFKHSPVLGAARILPESGWVIVAEQDRKEAFAPLNSLLLQMIIIALISLGAVIFISLILSRNITNPLLGFLNTSEVIAEGDLRTKVEVKSKDEIGQLGDAFNHLVESLKDIVTKIRNTADEVATASNELSSSAQEVSASAQEVSAATDQVNRGVRTQSERIEDTFKITEEISVSLREVVSNTQNLAQEAQSASKRADEGRKSIDESVEKINKLTETVTTTAEVIQGLGEKSRQIGEITETITSISDQINLLALNAAIEAARAGEAGRGFAVVAEEVRRLADNSSEAVKRIAGIISTIQNETQRAVVSIETSSRQMQEGKQLIQNVAGILGDINKAVAQTAAMTAEISSSGQEQLKGNEQVVKAVQEVVSIAKESTFTTEQVSNTVKEQTKAMQEMSKSAQELARLAEELKQMVGRFKLN